MTRRDLFLHHVSTTSRTSNEDWSRKGKGRTTGLLHSKNFLFLQKSVHLLEFFPAIRRLNYSSGKHHLDFKGGSCRELSGEHMNQTPLLTTALFRDSAVLTKGKQFRAALYASLSLRVSYHQPGIVFGCEHAEGGLCCTNSGDFMRPGVLADNLETRRSSHGFLFKLYGMPIDWKATVQRSVTKSTTEAKLVALSVAGAEMEWWQRALRASSLSSGLRHSSGATIQLQLVLLLREKIDFRESFAT
jgi:hypothetical protein